MSLLTSQYWDLMGGVTVLHGSGCTVMRLGSLGVPKLCAALPACCECESRNAKSPNPQTPCWSAVSEA